MEEKQKTMRNNTAQKKYVEKRHKHELKRKQLRKKGKGRSSMNFGKILRGK